MLVLSRRDQEAVRFDLGDGRVGWIAVKVEGGGKVKLVLDFPESVEILRAELLHSEQVSPPV